jgi:hypothetical protein
MNENPMTMGAEDEAREWLWDAGHHTPLVWTADIAWVREQIARELDS